ncbi:hypothetical protein T4B_1052 [Trichinella pseudospiralis]|uniref:Uncharacterized protein n=1 Tax=Trichinella pseudospiralis TaxID=6337 RepID=A0A0V1G9Q0_TRIPS|nr:hypothetical protein T4B_1052 [Trichinella pseudospiralis]
MEYMKISCLHITAAFNHRTTSRKQQKSENEAYNI